MLNLSMSIYFSVVLFFKGISLAIKEYIVIISNKIIVMIIMCKLSFNWTLGDPPCLRYQSPNYIFVTSRALYFSIVKLEQ